MDGYSNKLVGSKCPGEKNNKVPRDEIKTKEREIRACGSKRDQEIKEENIKQASKRALNHYK